MCPCTGVFTLSYPSFRDNIFLWWVNLPNCSLNSACHLLSVCSTLRTPKEVVYFRFLNYPYLYVLKTIFDSHHPYFCLQTPLAHTQAHTRAHMCKHTHTHTHTHTPASTNTCTCTATHHTHTWVFWLFTYVFGGLYCLKGLPWWLNW